MKKKTKTNKLVKRTLAFAKQKTKSDFICRLRSRKIKSVFLSMMVISHTKHREKTHNRQKNVNFWCHVIVSVAVVISITNCVVNLTSLQSCIFHCHVNYISFFSFFVSHFRASHSFTSCLTFAVQNRNVIGCQSSFCLNTNKKWRTTTRCNTFIRKMFWFKCQCKSAFLQSKDKKKYENRFKVNQTTKEETLTNCWTTCSTNSRNE